MNTVLGADDQPLLALFDRLQSAELSPDAKTSTARLILYKLDSDYSQRVRGARLSVEMSPDGPALSAWWLSQKPLVLSGQRFEIPPGLHWNPRLQQGPYNLARPVDPDEKRNIDFVNGLLLGG